MNKTYTHYQATYKPVDVQTEERLDPAFQIASRRYSTIC
jgi:hypothetical protein